MGSEMCIRDRVGSELIEGRRRGGISEEVEDVAAVAVLERKCRYCLLYTSDAADERSSVDLGGRRIIKKKKRSRNE